ncbi:hypothetical protein L210DRAFT_3356704, partial [Boletus edulis BED1]
ISFKIIHSTTILLPAWIANLEEFGMAVKMILHDVVTCWNSTFDMANFALEYHEYCNKLVTSPRKLGLTACSLDEHEWELLGQLRDTLKILKDAMLYFSRGTPNLAMVIPAMDYINNLFMDTMLSDDTVDLAICTAIQLAKKTLNWYYTLMDSSDLYRVSM